MTPLKTMRLQSGSSHITLQDENSDQGERRKSAKRTALLDLNDDCLHTVMSHVPIKDLCSIAQTSPRLKRIGVESFERAYKTFIFDEKTTKTTVDARKFFQIFGGLITKMKLNFSSCPKAEDIMDAVIRYCSKLECLRLTSYDIPDNQKEISDLGKLFQRLRTLHIENVGVEGTDRLPWTDNNLTTPNGNLMDFFVDCKYLTELSVSECGYLSRVIFESAFHNLESFEYFDGCIGCPMDGFTLRHKNLKSFRITTYDETDDVHLPVLKVISSNCKNLETLEFAFGTSLDRSAEYEASLKKLTRRKKLGVLRLCDVQKHGNMLAKIIPSFRDTLIHLDVTDAGYNYLLIPATCHLTELRVLILSECNLTSGNLSQLGELTELSALSITQVGDVSTFNLVQLVNRLVKLQKFRYQVGDSRIDPQTYFLVVDAVEKRKDVTKRTLLIDCRTTVDFVDTQVLTVKFGHIHPYREFQL